jgi:hypothetical protein
MLVERLLSSLSFLAPWPSELCRIDQCLTGHSLFSRVVCAVKSAAKSGSSTGLSPDSFSWAFRQRNALGDRPPPRSGGADNREGLRITFDYDLRAGVHTLQDGGEVAHRVGFTHAQD